MEVDKLHDTEALRIAIDRVPDAGLEVAVCLGSSWTEPLLGSHFRVLSEGFDVSFRASSMGEHLEVQGEMSIRLGYECSRCGESAEIALRESLRVFFLPPQECGDDGGTDAGAGGGGDIVVAAIRDRIADVEEPLREALVLAIPSYPLCREDCRGLCAGCGVNLNEGSCRCQETKVDSRWSKLAELRDKLGDSETS